MSKQSAGILVFRRREAAIEVLLVHPGGPFWAKKDIWSIPKGELDESEDHQTAARREFVEETGLTLPKSELIELGSAKQSSGKTNFVWAVESDIGLDGFTSNTFTMEWPPKSGQQQEFPEVDRIVWFDLAAAKRKLFKAQTVFIDRLAEHLQLDVAPEPQQQSLL